MEFIEITFSKPVNLASFNTTVLELTRDEGPNHIDTNVSIQEITDRSFRVSGLAAVSGLQGLYRFSIRTSGLTDLDGVAGSVSPQDVLTIINFLNRQSGAGEEESNSHTLIDRVFSDKHSLESNFSETMLMGGRDEFFALDDLIVADVSASVSRKRKRS